MNKTLLIWLFFCLVIHAIKLDNKIAMFIYFNINNLFMFIVAGLYYGMKPNLISLTVRNYCLVKIVIDLLLLFGVGKVNSWYYTIADMTIIFISVYYGLYFKKFIRTND